MCIFSKSAHIIYGATNYSQFPKNNLILNCCLSPTYDRIFLCTYHKCHDY